MNTTTDLTNKQDPTVQVPDAPRKKRGPNKVKSDVEVVKRPRGRPRTGEAKSSSDRVRMHDTALVDGGGRVINRLRLSKEASEALTKMKVEFKTERKAIEEALVFFCAQSKTA